MKVRVSLVVLFLILITLFASCKNETISNNSNAIDGTVTLDEKLMAKETSTPQDIQIDKDDEECKNVIEKYFDAISKQNIEQYNSTFAVPGGIREDAYFYQYFDVNVFSVVKQEGDIAKREEKSYRTYGRGNTLQPYKVLIYKVKYSMKRKYEDNSIKEIMHEPFFIMVKLKIDSSWKIDDIGV